jgi:phosphoserine phosphatase RsbU/P
VAFLQIVKGSRSGQIVELRGERTVLGRHPSCEIVLDNAAVSRQHAQIIRRQGDFFLEDLRSRNRTYLNGIPIEGRTPLNHTDEVKICDVVLQFNSSPPKGPDLSASKEGSTFEGTAGRSSHLGRTIPQGALPHPPSGDVDALGTSSSIISTLNAKSAHSTRLAIKPELKLRAILEISNALARTLKLDDVLESLLGGLFKVFPQADAGFVLLQDDNDKRIVKSAQARPADSTGSVRISNTIVQKAMDSGEAILSADALGDSRFDASESLDGLGIRSMMCVPILTVDEKALGVIQLDTTSLQQQFTQGDLDVLVSVSSQASLAIENARLHEDLVQRSEIERELRFATQVQLGFLPNERPDVPGYEFFDYYEPAHRVGGDYFDYIALPDGRIAIGLADVAGKGIPAALLMARMYSSVRLHVFTQPDSGRVLSALNAEIHAQGMGHRFVTFVLLTLDPHSHELNIANAGHLSPILRSPDGTATSIGRKQSGMPLGISATQEYRQFKVSLEPGATLVVYTDGITEAMNPASELFGRQRLERFVAAHNAPAGDLVRGIVREVDHFCGTYPQRDDMCLVCLRRQPQGEPTRVPGATSAPTGPG